MYQSRAQSEILAELQSFSTLAESTIEGSFTYDIFASNAIEFAKVEQELAQVYLNAFGHTAEGEYLELKAAESGVYRRVGKKATGEVEVTGTGLVKAGSVFATEDNVRFTALSDTLIAGSGSVAIEALTIGARFNLPANTITKMPLNIPGIRTCNNLNATFDGYDAESDDSLKARYLEKVRFPAASGNPREYAFWAMSVTGVGAVRVQRCWAGPGTVKVVIIDSNFQPANVLLLQRVYDYIESERPVGAQVTVVSAIPKTIDIAAKVIGNVDLLTFKSSVTNYLVDTTKNSLIDYSNADSYADLGEICYVSLAQIGAFLINCGADDYSFVTLNGAPKNVPLAVDEIAILGAVNLNG